MFAGLWPDVPVEETPITSVTNGVHAPTWVAPEMADLFSRYVSPGWTEARQASGSASTTSATTSCGERASTAADGSRSTSALGCGRPASLADSPPPSSSGATSVLDPKVLTIGFARRFATYKRATLLLSQPERLAQSAAVARPPVQFVFAGKAHPADELGKELIREIVALRGRSGRCATASCSSTTTTSRVARDAVPGRDVWLNNPRRPQEACGTSGMKAALNGALNCSILDGWWDECFDGANGWAITSAESETTSTRRDEIEANSLFELLEHQIVPLFYERLEGPVPRRWVRRMKHVAAHARPRGHRRSHGARLRHPALRADREPRRLASTRTSTPPRRSCWRGRSGSARRGRASASSTSSPMAVPPTSARCAAVEATVDLGDLEPEDVSVQLLHGRSGRMTRSSILRSCR